MVVIDDDSGEDMMLLLEVVSFISKHKLPLSFLPLLIESCQTLSVLVHKEAIHQRFALC